MDKGDVARALRGVSGAACVQYPAQPWEPESSLVTYQALREAPAVFADDQVYLERSEFQVDCWAQTVEEADLLAEGVSEALGKLGMVKLESRHLDEDGLRRVKMVFA